MAKNVALQFEDMQSLFLSASSYVKKIISKLTSQQMLEFYGLYKQATEGPCTKPKPSWYELTEKQKWEAWSSLKDLNINEAMQKYLTLLYAIDPQWLDKTSVDGDHSNEWVHHSCMKNDDDKIEDSKKTIFDWVKESNLDKVKSCAAAIASEINKLDNDGMGLLHWATDRGSLDIVKYFVENLKADVNIKDKDGQTPLHYAVSCEYSDVCDYLIEAGADATLKDNEGNTAYDAN